MPEETSKDKDNLVDGDQDVILNKDPSDPTGTKDVRTNSGPTPPTGDAGLQGSKQNPNVPSALNPTDAMKAGGGGPDTDLQTVVDERRVGQSTTGEPGEEKPKNRMVAENNIDLDVEGDHTQTAQGNKYGLSRAAARNYRDKARADAENLGKDIERLNSEADEWDRKYQELGGDDPEEAGVFDPGDMHGVDADAEAQEQNSKKN